MALDRDTVERIARKWSSGMSAEQMDWYVIHSHVTKDRQIKQCLLEIESRSHNLDKVSIEKRKHEIKYKQIQAELEKESDPYERQLLELELESMDLDFNVFNRRVETMKKELNVFYDHLIKLDIDEAELEKKLEYDPTEERKYWIARMGKQAALDFIVQGRIGTGNLDSIAMMSEQDQQAIFEVAIQYSSLFNVSMNKIQQKLAPYLSELQKSNSNALPTFHGIEENFEVSLLSELKTVKGELNESKSNPKPPENLQLTYKPQTT